METTLLLELVNIGSIRPAKQSGFSIKTVTFEDIITGKQYTSIFRSSDTCWDFNLKKNQIWKVTHLTVQEKVGEKNLLMPDALHSSVFTQDALIRDNNDLYWKIEDNTSLRFRNKKRQTIVQFEKINVLGDFQCIEVKDHDTSDFQCSVVKLKDREIAEKYFINLKQLR